MDHGASSLPESVFSRLDFQVSPSNHNQKHPRSEGAENLPLSWGTP